MTLNKLIIAGIAGVLAGIAATSGNKRISGTAAVVAGALLAAASTSPSIATTTVGIATGKLPKRATGSTVVALALATYVLAYVILNEHIFLIPAALIASAAMLDEMYKWVKGITLPALLIMIAPWIGWEGPAAAGVFCMALGACGLLVQARKGSNRTANDIS